MIEVIAFRVSPASIHVFHIWCTGTHFSKQFAHTLCFCVCGLVFSVDTICTHHIWSILHCIAYYDRRCRATLVERHVLSQYSNAHMNCRLQRLYIQTKWLCLRRQQSSDSFMCTCEPQKSRKLCCFNRMCHVRLSIMCCCGWFIERWLDICGARLCWGIYQCPAAFSRATLHRAYVRNHSIDKSIEK